jgi:hypothetical protein
MEITATRPNYHLFENNCQNFAKFLVEAICTVSVSPETIENVLQRLGNAGIVPVPVGESARLPGTYPITVKSTLDEWFTASDNSTAFFGVSEGVQGHLILTDEEEREKQPSNGGWIDRTVRWITNTEL